MIGDNIKAIRTQKNRSQQQTADSLFVTQQAVNRWENNDTIPQIDRITEIAKTFSVPVEAILFSNDDNRSYAIAVDRTQELKDDIDRLKEINPDPKTDLKDYVRLIASENLLNGDSPQSGPSGKYYIHVEFNEFEYNLWKVLRYYNPDYSLNNFLAFISQADAYRVRRRTLPHPTTTGC